MENENDAAGKSEQEKKEINKENSTPINSSLDPQWIRTIIERCNELCGERSMN